MTKAEPPVDNPFFNFLNDDKTPLDLSAIIPIDFSLKSSVLGYVGTMTTPNCERGVCWYFGNETYSISPAQFAKLKVAGVDANSRGVNPIMPSYKQYDAPGLLYVPS